MGSKTFEEIHNITDVLVNLMFLINEVPPDSSVESEYSFKQLLDLTKVEVARLGALVDLQGKKNHKFREEDKRVVDRAVN
jgi:hypothetical protein